MYMNLDSQWETVSDENYPEKYKQLKGHPKEIDVYDILNFIETKIAAEITNNNSAANNMRLKTYKLYLEHGNIIANDTYEAHKQEKARQQEEARQKKEARQHDFLSGPETFAPSRDDIDSILRRCSEHGQLLEAREHNCK